MNTKGRHSDTSQNCVLMLKLDGDPACHARAVAIEHAYYGSILAKKSILRLEWSRLSCIVCLDRARVWSGTSPTSGADRLLPLSMIN